MLSFMTPAVVFLRQLLRHVLGMKGIGFSIARILRFLPAETAHHLGLRCLASPMVVALMDPPLLPRRDLSCKLLPGLSPLMHPVGLAAGYDKDATSIRGLFKLGFSFVEVGTVTVRAQYGHKKPRLFRLHDSMELINRMGFPNKGAQVMQNTLSHFHQWLHPHGSLDSSTSVTKDPDPIVGINVGKNKDTPLEAAIDDYILAMEMLLAYGSYFTINISSPNTAGLRSLATSSFFKVLSQRSSALESHLPSKIWIKLSCDDPQEVFQKHIEDILAAGFAGLILTNTHAVNQPFKGGLSGHSLRSLAMQRLLWAKEVHQGHLSVIAVGGIITGRDILHAICLGASAVQIYTALVYRGPQVVAKMLKELDDELNYLGLKNLEEARQLVTSPYHHHEGFS
ncbi:MAG: quinone-dependent dihydroorotate dehydrogenase [Proteobacteria bacterium]|nr:quinone-dependent dihydroorotate dehydrogenase [Pseudomonadota bacterium]